MIFPRSRVTTFSFISALAAFFSILTLSCGSTSSTVSSENVSSAASAETINLVFAGDIMAHTVNYKPGNFSRIWEDVSQLISEGDLSFGNLEAPVNDQKDWSTYPQFNLHSTYVQAAVDAGFNVFSLTNNHTNDWGLEGINATRNYFSSRNDVWATGLRKKNDGKITWRLIEKNGWKILFVSITELLNRPDASTWIDYFPPKKHDNLVEQLKKLSQEQKHDLFVISVHTDEVEYKTKVTDSHKQFFSRLVSDCNIDIVWANHPHVYKEFERISVPQGDVQKQAFVMYANGNTISGQRTSPSFGKTPNERDDTGDGLIIKLTYQKNEGSKPALKTVEPHMITTFIQPDGQYVIRHVDDDLIHCLKRSGLRSWAEYLTERRKIFETLKGKSQWQ